MTVDDLIFILKRESIHGNGNNEVIFRYDGREYMEFHLPMNTISNRAEGMTYITMTGQFDLIGVLEAKRKSK